MLCAGDSDLGLEAWADHQFAVGILLAYRYSGSNETFLFPSFHQNLISAIHAHGTEIRNQVHAVRMTSKLALGALSSLAFAQRQHVPAMAAPAYSDI